VLNFKNILGRVGWVGWIFLENVLEVDVEGEMNGPSNPTISPQEMVPTTACFKLNDSCCESVFLTKSKEPIHLMNSPGEWIII
jgi:hypothetical protein